MKYFGIVAKALPYLIILFTLSIHCSSGPKRHKAVNIPQLLQRKKIAISQGTLSPRELVKERVGTQGFFYFLDRNGRVSAHPNTNLQGMDFKRFPFVSYILAESRGCIQAPGASGLQAMFFERLADGSRLCLSIPLKELATIPTYCKGIKTIN